MSFLATYLRDDLSRPERLRDWHHVTGVPNNEIGEAATFGVVADQLATSVRKEYSLRNQIVQHVGR